MFGIVKFSTFTLVVIDVETQRTRALKSITEYSQSLSINPHPPSLPYRSIAKTGLVLHYISVISFRLLVMIRRARTKLSLGMPVPPDTSPHPFHSSLDSLPRMSHSLYPTVWVYISIKLGPTPTNLYTTLIFQNGVNTFNMQADIWQKIR